MEMKNLIYPWTSKLDGFNVGWIRIVTIVIALFWLWAVMGLIFVIGGEAEKTWQSIGLCIAVALVPSFLASVILHLIHWVKDGFEKSDKTKHTT